jgi:DEAD/DEAH box helicase domain-containing protein
MGLQCYLDRQPEPNWLYLENEYIQFVNALCAAEEQTQAPNALYSRRPFATLPESFVELVENELRPTRPIPSDLYPLKQQAIGGAHRAFPLRSGVEKTYQVTCRNMPNGRLGNLSYSQVLREAFPGAIYRYLARPYRVVQIKHPTGEIIVAKARGFPRTTALSQTAVFPQFGEAYYLRRSAEAFIAECRLQVSERVIGFEEHYGAHKAEVLYGTGSSYAQKPLIRYIDTTGVCFYFPDEALQRDKLGKYIALAFCRVCSIQERDVGWGTFIAQASPLGAGALRGFAVYDSAYGSLRLTRQLPESIEEVLREASRVATEESAPQIAAAAEQLLRSLALLGDAQQNDVAVQILGSPVQQEWVTVIAPDQPAICHDGQSHVNEEVLVLHHLYTPQGIRYTLKVPKEGVQWLVSAAMIHPINGLTRLEQYNVNTGETRPLPG